MCGFREALMAPSGVAANQNTIMTIIKIWNFMEFLWENIKEYLSKILWVLRGFDGP